MFSKEERERITKQIEDKLERLGRSTGIVITSNPSGRNPFYKKFFEDDIKDAHKYTIGSFWINESVIGLPHEVHFKENKNRTTLVWKRGDNYSTTTSEAHEEKFDRLYGFLMAYFKKIHQHESKTWRKKYLEKNVYPLKHKEQKHFLTTIFAQNCGLSTEEVYKYLNEIVKDKE